MMTPLRFEELYEREWIELETLLGMVARKNIDRSPQDGPLGTDRPRASTPMSAAPPSGARIAALYRRACEQLALARARSYPMDLIDRLERITGTAHQLIYYRREYGLERLKQLAAVDFPRAVRAQRSYVAAAAATFLLPTIVIGLLVYWRPELILSVVDSNTAASFEEMYSPSADSIGRSRSATTDWMMFGFYIRNNIGVAFQCFAGGLFAGLGSLFFLAYNGAFAGALAGYLTAHGLASTFYSFVVTHSSFEMTAIVLSGAAGLRIGHSLLAPGRLTRTQSLTSATRESAVLLYGITAMLLIAAAVEAFWSSANWLPLAVKYTVAALCWIAVFAYFTFQGRRAA